MFGVSDVPYVGWGPHGCELAARGAAEARIVKVLEMGLSAPSLCELIADLSVQAGYTPQAFGKLLEQLGISSE
jgi:hypothetical protein